MTILHNVKEGEIIMKRSLALSMFVLILMSGAVAGGVIAYFTQTRSTPTNTFDNGTVLISANETLIPTPVGFINLIPGSVQEAEYTVRNTGSLAIYLRVGFLGSWEPVMPSNGQHTNTATVHAEYLLPNSEDRGTIMKSDSANYYVQPESEP